MVRIGATAREAEGTSAAPHPPATRRSRKGRTGGCPTRHRTGSYLDDYGFALALTDRQGSLSIWRQVNLMASHPFEALLSNDLNPFTACSVEQRLWRIL
jgi:hypothetical protein